MDTAELWRRYNRHLCKCPGVGLSLDISRMPFDDGFFRRMQPAMRRAFEAMAALESGAIANPDEKRMVGHYWLRAPQLAPDHRITEQIERTVADVLAFARDVHAGHITTPEGRKFTDLMLVGIGGSALGPQLVADALGSLGGRRDKLRVHFLDNTDPDGINRELHALGARIRSTMVLVISKSGGTRETRNGMIAVKDAIEGRGDAFAPRAVAVTGEGSHLDNLARNDGWLRRFPMWDWVGGRTSVLSAVGLLPAALQGLDAGGLLAGAAAMDRITRRTETRHNPAALLALMWHLATNGRGEKDMVVLPYKDRLGLLSRYLQQLVMESLGKEHDLDDQVVNQGIAVYGNKGSTDQHAYVQQLRDGVNNFFVTFIVCLQDTARPGRTPNPEVEPDITSGDYLSGFWQGTREALFEKGRGAITITIDKLSAKTLGALIALYERAVGFYATLVNINAYHQPGVEAGKKAATAVLEWQGRIVGYLRDHPDAQLTADELAEALGAPDRAETVFHVLQHLAANKRFVERRGKQYHWPKALVRQATDSSA